MRAATEFLLILLILLSIGWTGVIFYVAVGRFNNAFTGLNKCKPGYVQVRADSLLAVKEALFENQNEQAIKMMFLCTESINPYNAWGYWEQVAKANMCEEIVFVDNLK